MLGTAIFLIASFLLILFLYAIAELITYWWAYLLIILASIILVKHDSLKNKK